VSTDTAMLKYSPQRSQQFYDQAIAKVSAIPGVESVVLATRVPLQVNASRWEIWVPGRHQPGEHGDTVEVTTVSTHYFKTPGDANSLLRDMRRELLSLDPNVVFVENQTMEMEVDATLFPMRASAWMVSGVGVVAMLLAAIGLYGVIAYAVARRTREIGIRMALGANRGKVISMVMKEVALMAILGVAAGLPVALGLSRLIRPQLFGLAPDDALTLVLP